uniref:Uncharacterized protein n=1 Tax=Rhizophora mucronata TaxID=61149 RepID=A0A2P2P7Y8_RHIMU
MHANMHTTVHLHKHTYPSSEIKFFL